LVGLIQLQSLFIKKKERMEKNAIKTFLILKGFSFSDPFRFFRFQSLEKICETIATTIG
jgi:hypothetical protein